MLTSEDRLSIYHIPTSIPFATNIFRKTMTGKMTFCEHIMRTDEISEPRAYRRVWLAKCIRCEVRDFVWSEMFECVECHVYIHRRCWQSVNCSPKSPPVARPELSATAAERGAELGAAQIELPERSVVAVDRESEERCVKTTRDVGTNTCQLYFVEPVAAVKPTGGCQAVEEPTFSPSEILRKIREAKRSRSSHTPGNIPAHFSNEYVDLLGHPRKPGDQVRRETLLELRTDPARPQWKAYLHGAGDGGDEEGDDVN